jgi:hypothetical protein
MNVSEKTKVLNILLNKLVITLQSLLAMPLEKIGHGTKILESRQNSGESQWNFNQMAGSI